MGYQPEELLICVIARLLRGVDHVAVGVSSPIPGSATLLQRELSGGQTRVTVLNSRHLQTLNDGAGDLFDRAAQGRIGAFFLSGGQIDGRANINLVGIGDYPQQSVRWSGSFGSAFLYYIVPRVILFREEHTRRTMVEKVDFISAPGISDTGVYRPGGPYALVTNLGLFHFDKARARFHLTSIHPGHSLEEILDNTGFDFDRDADIPTTPAPEPERLKLLRGKIAREIADPYPKFAKALFGV
ncbi:MAG: CoA synthetase [Alphaproteobacteria bacterium]|nr:CoA synthetase [Alphaproteobacteria bacterium]